MSDIRNAARSLRATPSFTAVALTVLTLGIGASTAIFSVVDAVALRGLPFDDAARLVAVSETSTKTGRASSVAAPNFVDWRAQQDVFEDLGAISFVGGFSVRDSGQPEDLRAMRMTASLLHVLRVSPRLGPGFTAANEVDGNNHVLILSDGLWRRRFGADPHVIGKTMTFDTGTWEIVGVMPPGFTYPLTSEKPAAIWVPYVVPADQKVRGNSRSYYLQVVGRLKPGVTIERARARMQQINDGLATQFPKWFRDRGISVVNLHESLVGQVRSWMLLLLGSVAFVLLIACVNVANLMLARATSRGREIGIRAALGATRWQLARGLLVESLMLSVAGACGGVVVAWWGVQILHNALPANLPHISAIAVDLRVLGATALASVVTGVLCGLVPAFQFSRPDVANALREGGRSSTAGVVRQRLRTTLVVAEVALAVVLLVGAGLFVSSFVRLMRIDLGLDYHNVLTVPVYANFDFSNKDARERGFAHAQILVPAVVERVRQIPGVDVASALANGLPLSGSWSRNSVKVPGREKEFDGDDSVDVREVTADYLKAVRIPLLRGRYFTDADNKTSAPVILLSEFSAKRYFPDRDALGATIGVYGDRTVVGIVGSLRLGGPETEVRPESYLPMAQGTIAGADLVLRTSGDPLSVLPAVKAAIWSVDPTLTIADAQTLEEFLQRLIAQRRFNMLLLSLFGVLAIVIAAVGIYGVMAYIVEQRTQEIGVRMALGALPGRILRMVLGRAAVFMMAGLALGLAGAWGLARFVASFLFKVQPHDPVVYALVALVLLTAGLIAAFLPARRAASVDPLVALRRD
jgi:predicted permease